MHLKQKLFAILLPAAFLLPAGVVCAQSVEIYGNACEKVVQGESKSSTRVRAADKAVFLRVKKIKELDKAKQILNEHDLNVLVYRLVDEYVEDLSVNTTKDEEDKICVEIKGWLNPQNVAAVENEFFKDDVPLKEASAEMVAEVADDVKAETLIKPDNPESLALVHIAVLEYYNGAKSGKFTEPLKEQFSDNPYFYLTEDAEIADYVIRPKVLKAKVDKLDAGHKRLQMVVTLEIYGLEEGVVNEYQNRFVLFGAEEDEQKTASRLLNKLLENAGDGALRKIEHHEQERLEQKEIGRSLSNNPTTTENWSF